MDIVPRVPPPIALLGCQSDLPERPDLSRVVLVERLVVQKIDGADGVRQEVYNSYRYQFAVEPVTMI